LPYKRSSMHWEERCVSSSVTCSQSKAFLLAQAKSLAELGALELFMGASEQGWGFYSSHRQVSPGQWLTTLRSFHINIREFMAVWIAIKSCRWKRGTALRLHLGNSSVVNCLNGGGGSTRSVPLWSWTLSVARSLGLRDLTLIAVHIRGEHNALADSLSRSHLVHEEWSLDSSSFLWIRTIGIVPQVD